MRGQGTTGRDDDDDRDDDDLHDRDLADLDDVADREELRDRYYGLIQELRVVLPGVQVLLAFLLTVPFAQRFGELDGAGRTAYGIALGTSTAAVMFLLAPAVFHRTAPRQARVARLRWGIRFTMLGLVLVAAALVTSMWCVVRLVFGTPQAAILATGAVVIVLATWIVIPVLVGRREH